MFITREIEVLTEEICGYRCDICENEVMGEDMPPSWYVFQRGCEDPDCGCGGIELSHACSPRCYFKLLGKQADDDDVATNNLIEFVLPLYKEK